MATQFDLIVIGAGPGGYSAAIRAAQYGMKVAIIEKDAVGGTCLNRGCMPTKIYLHAADLFSEMQHSEIFGVQAREVSYDLAAMKIRKDVVLNQLRGGIEKLLAAHKITYIRGIAKIMAAGKVTVGDELYTTAKILIAVGSRPASLPIPGLTLPGVLTSDDLLTGELPDFKQLTIIGGGVIGVEFASFYQSLGCDVTIIEAMERILPNLDREIAQNLTMIMKKRGIKIFTGAKVTAIEQNHDGGLKCNFICKENPQMIMSDGVLISIGRSANTDDLLSESVDLGLERGRIPVDENFVTKVLDIYAIGDVVLGGIQLAHMAAAEGLCAVANMCGKLPPLDLNVVPSCIYTSPEIATVGLTADEAKAAGIPVKTGKFIMNANGKTMIENGERGFIKVVFHAKTETLLGAQLMCSRATDMVGELAAAIVNRLAIAQLAAVIHPHPTFVEAIGEAVDAAEGLSLHTLKRG